MKQAGKLQTFTLCQLSSKSNPCSPPPHPQFYNRPHTMVSLSSLSTPIPATKQILTEHPVFLPPVDPLSPSSPSPFLSNSSQYLETHYTRDPQMSHLPGTPRKIFLPGNTHPPHSPKNQRGKQKPRDKTPTQQRSDQISDITENYNLPNTPAQKHSNSQHDNMSALEQMEERLLGIEDKIEKK